MRWRIIMVGLVVMAAGVGSCGYGAFGSVVTSSTGVASGDQKAFFLALEIGGVVAFASGIVLMVLRGRARKAT